MALAFMSVSALLLALTVRTSSLENQSGDLQMDCFQTPSY